MTHVLRAQTRTVATTKIAFAGVPAMAAFAALISRAPAVLAGKHQDPHTVLDGAATIAAVTAMLPGAPQTSGDLQNEMTRALLPADPRRLRVLGAQLPASLGQGAGAGVTAAPLADATQAVPGRHGLPAAAIARAAAGTTTAAALSGPLGAAAGITLRNPALAACVIVPWSHPAEPFISTLPYHTYTYLPGGARESLTHHHPAHHHIPPPAGGLIPAGWAAATALTAAPAFTRHDAA